PARATGSPTSPAPAAAAATIDFTEITTYPPGSSCDAVPSRINNTCMAVCPPTFVDRGVLGCERPTTVRTQWFFFKSACLLAFPTCEKVGWVWYPTCRSGYVSAGPLCVAACPSSAWQDRGPLCGRPSRPFVDDVVRCPTRKNTYVGLMAPIVETTMGACLATTCAKNRRDGCSVPQGSSGAIVAYSGFFKAACDVHDMCYATEGRPQAQCDSDFEKNMKVLCKAGKPVGEIGVCNSAADAFVTAVRVAGFSSWTNGQLACKGQTVLYSNGRASEARGMDLQLQVETISTRMILQRFEQHTLALRSHSLQLLARLCASLLPILPARLPKPSHAPDKSLRHSLARGPRTRRGAQNLHVAFKIVIAALLRSPNRRITHVVEVASGLEHLNIVLQRGRQPIRHAATIATPLGTRRPLALRRHGVRDARRVEPDKNVLARRTANRVVNVRAGWAKAYEPGVAPPVAGGAATKDVELLAAGSAKVEEAPWTGEEAGAAELDFSLAGAAVGNGGGLCQVNGSEEGGEGSCLVGGRSEVECGECKGGGGGDEEDEKGGDGGARRMHSAAEESKLKVS
ncbi:hypothetical protein HDU96_008431, partial [Phlyctochytrium bullatum]